jgi:hypothetical protein
MKRPDSHHRHPARSLTTPDRVVVSCASGREIGGAALERLEELDDTIFAALDGDPEALDRSRELWSTVARELEPPLVAESGAQYARHARTVFDASRSNPEQSLSRAFAALEVLGLLADD